MELSISNQGVDDPIGKFPTMGSTDSLRDRFATRGPQTHKDELNHFDIVE